MDPSARQPVTNLKIYNITQNQDNIISQVSDIIQNNIDSLREQYNKKIKEVAAIEFNYQYKEAEKEYRVYRIVKSITNNHIFPND